MDLYVVFRSIILHCIFGFRQYARRHKHKAKIMPLLVKPLVSCKSYYIRLNVGIALRFVDFSQAALYLSSE